MSFAHTACTACARLHRLCTPANDSYGLSTSAFWRCYCTLASIAQTLIGYITALSPGLPDKCWRKVFLPSRCHRAAWRRWWSWRWWAASALSDQWKVPRACWASCLWFRPVPAESHPARSFERHSLSGVSGLVEQKQDSSQLESKSMYTIQKVAAC